MTSAVSTYNEGSTAMDIAIQRDMVKNVELMVQKLALLPNFRLSNSLYTHFPTFFCKDLRTFFQYLDTYFFRTIQMQQNNKLLLNSEEDLYIFAHNSSLIN